MPRGSSTPSLDSYFGWQVDAVIRQIASRMTFTATYTIDDTSKTRIRRQGMGSTPSEKKRLQMGPLDRAPAKVLLGNFSPRRVAADVRSAGFIDAAFSRNTSLHRFHCTTTCLPSADRRHMSAKLAGHHGITEASEILRYRIYYQLKVPSRMAKLKKYKGLYWVSLLLQGLEERYVVIQGIPAEVELLLGLPAEFCVGGGKGSRQRGRLDGEDGGILHRNTGGMTLLVWTIMMEANETVKGIRRVLAVLTEESRASIQI